MSYTNISQDKLVDQNAISRPDQSNLSSQGTCLNNQPLDLDFSKSKSKGDSYKKNYS